MVHFPDHFIPRIKTIDYTTQCGDFKKKSHFFQKIPNCNWLFLAMKYVLRDQNVEVKELEREVEEEFKKIQFSDDFIGLVIRKLKNAYHKQKKEIDVEKRILYNQKLAVERKRDLVEEKLLSGVISEEDFTRIRARINEELSQIQLQLDELESRRTLDVNVIRGVLHFTRDIYSAYKKAPYELKRQLLGLFWEKFFVQDRRIVRAIPTSLVRILLEERQVIIRSNWLPRQDSNYS